MSDGTDVAFDGWPFVCQNQLHKLKGYRGLFGDLFFCLVARFDLGKSISPRCIREKNSSCLVDCLLIFGGLYIG